MDVCDRRKAGDQELTENFSVYVQPENGAISHGLATALMDREGKIVRVWRGNGWTPEEITREIDGTAKSALATQRCIGNNEV